MGHPESCRVLGGGDGSRDQNWNLDPLRRDARIGARILETGLRPRLVLVGPRHHAAGSKCTATNSGSDSIIKEARSHIEDIRIYEKERAHRITWEPKQSRC